MAENKLQSEHGSHPWTLAFSCSAATTGAPAAALFFSSNILIASLIDVPFDILSSSAQKANGTREADQT